MALGEIQSAVKLRDVITSIARSQINELRPSEKIGKVYSINLETRVAKIYLPGETVNSLLEARFASDKIPSQWMESTFATYGYDAPANVVRVVGRTGSYYILDYVSGSPAVDPGARALIVDNAQVINDTLDEVNQQLTVVNAEIAQLNIDLDNLNGTGGDLSQLQSDLGQLQLEVDALNDVTIPALNTRLATAESEIIDRTQVRFQTTQPTGLTSSDRVVWYDTDNGYTASYWNGANWSPYQLSGAAILPGGIVTSHMAANTIHGSVISAGTLNADRILAGSISTLQFSSNTIDASIILTNTLHALKIVTGSIMTDRMTVNSINADRLLVNTILGDRILANQIGAGHIIANSISADKIASNAVTADKIAANAITAAKIQAGAIDGMLITGAMIRTGASGPRIELDGTVANKADRMLVYDLYGTLAGQITANQGARTFNIDATGDAILSLGGSLIHLNNTTRVWAALEARSTFSVTGTSTFQGDGYVTASAAWAVWGNTNLNRIVANYGDGVYSSELSLSVGCPFYGSQYYGWSDMRHKSNLAPVESALDTLDAWPVSDYDTPHGGAPLEKGGKNKLKRQRGVMAQDVQANAPHLVATGEGDFGLAVDLYGIQATTIAGVQELNTMVKELTNRLAQLEGNTNG